MLADSGCAPLSTQTLPLPWTRRAVDAERELLRLQRGVDHRDFQRAPIGTQCRDDIERIGRAAGAHLRMVESHRIARRRLRRIAVHDQRQRAGAKMLAVELEHLAVGVQHCAVGVTSSVDTPIVNAPIVMKSEWRNISCSTIE